MLVTLLNYLQKGITVDLCRVAEGRRPSVIHYHHNELSLKFDIEEFFYKEHLPELEHTFKTNGHFSKSQLPFMFGTV